MSSSPYCVWGLCEYWEVCCGHNKCCDEIEFSNLFLTVMVLGTLSILALCFGCFYCTSRNPYFPLIRNYLSLNYVEMSVENGSTTKEEPMTVNQDSSDNCIAPVHKTRNIL